jgi:hypothetical protein
MTAFLVGLICGVAIGVVLGFVSSSLFIVGAKETPSPQAGPRLPHHRNSGKMICQGCDGRGGSCAGCKGTGFRHYSHGEWQEHQRRMPQRPEALVGALQDVIHRDTGRVRPAKAVRTHMPDWTEHQRDVDHLEAVSKMSRDEAFWLGDKR